MPCKLFYLHFFLNLHSRKSGEYPEKVAWYLFFFFSTWFPSLYLRISLGISYTRGKVNWLINCYVALAQEDKFFFLLHFGTSKISYSISPKKSLKKVPPRQLLLHLAKKSFQSGVLTFFMLFVKSHQFLASINISIVLEAEKSHKKGDGDFFFPLKTERYWKLNTIISNFK